MNTSLPGPSLAVARRGQERNIFDVLRERDILLYHPATLRSVVGLPRLQPTIGCPGHQADAPSHQPRLPVAGALIRAAESGGRDCARRTAARFTRTQYRQARIWKHAHVLRWPV
jgi:hypothetical protein